MSFVRIPALTVAVLLGLGMAVAAGAQNSQQMMMQHCNAEASSRHLMGRSRQDFMRTCLSSPSKRHLALNSQQRRMKSCDARAKSKGLTGSDRKRFMSSCLRLR
jgi:hypothetical protein